MPLSGYEVTRTRSRTANPRIRTRNIPHEHTPLSHVVQPSTHPVSGLGSSQDLADVLLESIGPARSGRVLQSHQTRIQKVGRARAALLARHRRRGRGVRGYTLVPPRSLQCKTDGQTRTGHWTVDRTVNSPTKNGRRLAGLVRKVVTTVRTSLSVVCGLLQGQHNSNVTVNFIN